MRWLGAFFNGIAWFFLIGGLLGMVIGLIRLDFVQFFVSWMWASLASLRIYIHRQSASGPG